MSQTNPANGYVPYEHDGQNQPSSPYRDVNSPPPEYASPTIPEPISPARSREYRPASRHSHSYSQERVSRETQRRPVASQLPDDIPPPPPPHKITSRQDYADPYIPHQRDGLEPQRSMIPPPLSDRDSSRNSSPYNYPSTSRFPERGSYGSGLPLTAGAATPGSVTPGASLDPRSSRYSARSIPLEDYPSSVPSMAYTSYEDTPYQHSNRFSTAVNHADINPNNILDDGDDGFMPEPQRKSMFHTVKSQSEERVGTAGPVAGAAAGAGVFSAFGRKQKNQVPSATYNPVTSDGTTEEKSEWLSRQTNGKHRMRWMIGVIIGAVIVLAIIAGIVGGVLGTHSGGDGSKSSSTNNADSDTAANGDLGSGSAEIQALMNNKNLHKVFPGMDYTPWGTQYPLCTTYPPSQNNVTRDIAVLSQLTNNVRLYGTDCNQTEMVLHAINRLGLKDMKVWLGVWVDTNQTTTDRQLKQMYNILEKTDDLSIFKGAIIGNEALYRAGEDKSQSEQELIEILTDVKSQFKSKGYDLPIATSDLGDNWNGQLVEVVDVVMSNIHPFFAGVTAEEAAGWTWNFWQTHDVVLTASLPNVKQIISETGWPSGGGKDCGGTTGECGTGQSGAIASVDNMNIFMENWVCQALENGTDYFWFEAFDEPWKIVYNKGDQNWEDKWGLMDQARKLKSGVQIPDCGGKTVS